MVVKSLDYSRRLKPTRFRQNARRPHVPVRTGTGERQGRGKP